MRVRQCTNKRTLRSNKSCHFKPGNHLQESRLTFSQDVLSFPFGLPATAVADKLSSASQHVIPLAMRKARRTGVL